MRASLILATIAAAGLAATGAIAADRAPTAAERAAIEKTLRAAGYVSWEEIELDDDGPYWEVDDARKADNLRWDIRLAPGTYKLIRAERDD